MFFSATKTLGADTTAILVSDVAPSRSCLARRLAVSSEYCERHTRTHQQPSFPISHTATPFTLSLNGRALKAGPEAYPELRLVPVLAESLHRQRVHERRLTPCRLAVLGRGFELLKVLRAGIPLRVELL